VAAAKGRPLRVILADADGNGLTIAALVRGLGYEVVGEERADADLVIIGPGLSGAEGLDLIEPTAAAATCRVIAFLPEADEHVISEAADAGVETYIIGNVRESWPRMIETVLRPFTDLHDLEAALGRRALIERAKGILMERYGVREGSAFELIRSEARNTNHRVVEVASAVVDGHRLLARDHQVEGRSQA
jgi:response regulator NasT